MKTKREKEFSNFFVPRIVLVVCVVVIILLIANYKTIIPWSKKVIDRSVEKKNPKILMPGTFLDSQGRVWDSTGFSKIKGKMRQDSIAKNN
jgi:hypothetical protein